MRKLALMTAALTAPLMFAACDQIPFLKQTNEQKIVGDWDCEPEGMPDGIGSVTMSFEKGGDLVVNMRGELSQGGQTLVIDADITGDWEVDEDELTITAKGAELNKLEMKGGGMDLSSYKDQFAQEMKANADEGKFEIKRLEGEKLTLVDKDSDEETKCTKE